MKILHKLKSHLPKLLILAMMLTAHTTVFAQSRQFAPPTILPAEDAVVGNVGGECYGLATMIRTGNVSLRSIPCFIKIFTQTVIGIAGSLSVIFVMYGGYEMVLQSSENKEKGKKTIMYALIGLVVSLLAFLIVDIALQVATE